MPQTYGTHDDAAHVTIVVLEGIRDEVAEHGVERCLAGAKNRQWPDALDDESRSRSEIIGDRGDQLCGIHLLGTVRASPRPRIREQTLHERLHAHRAPAQSRKVVRNIWRRGVPQLLRDPFGEQPDAT